MIDRKVRVDRFFLDRRELTPLFHYDMIETLNAPMQKKVILGPAGTENGNLNENIKTPTTNKKK